MREKRAQKLNAAGLLWPTEDPTQEPQVHGDDALGAETRIHGEYAQQASAEEARYNQKHKSDSKLRRGKELPQSLLSKSADLSSAFLI